MIVSSCRKLQCLSACQINFIIHFFPEIIHFKESCNLTGRQHFGQYIKNQNFARYGIGGETSITILVFTIGYFQQKLMTKFFKIPKNPIWWQFLCPFCSNLGKNRFSWKKGLGQFLIIPIIYHRVKNQKKLMSHS